MWQVQQFSQTRSVDLSYFFILVLSVSNCLFVFFKNVFSVISDLLTYTNSILCISASPACYSLRYCLLWRESACPFLHLNEDGEHMVVVWKHSCMFEDSVIQHFCRNKLFPPSLFICQDFPRCDLLIIMGTSLQVQPFASLVSRYCRSSFIFLKAVADHTLCCSNNVAECCNLAASETILQHESFRLISSYDLI